MTIYSDTLQQLTDQYVSQVATLMQAVTAGDTAGISSGANTIESTMNSIYNTITGADIPADNTMVLFLVQLSQSQITTLQQQISANNTQGITDAANAVNETSVNYNHCVTRMGEAIIVQDPLDVRPWMGGAL